MLRLSSAGQRLLDAWLAGDAVDDTAASLELRSRLVDAGILHPVFGPDRDRCQTPLRIGFVVPVYDDPVGVARAVASIRAAWPEAPVVVVDDASPSVVELVGATVVRQVTNLGPGAARNRGVRELPPEVDVVVFIDSDVVVEQGCTEKLSAHFDDPAVTAVAPRIQAEPGTTALDRYEARNSPLDLGADAAVVRPGSPVPYLPSTVLAVRRAAFEKLGGFDESMRVGEDVDLIWRLVDAGAFIRYEPAAIARHRNRADWAALARQRFGYGTAAARLDAKHPGDVAPIEMPAPMLTAWGAAALGGPLGLAAGVGISAFEMAKLHQRLGQSVEDTVRLSAMGHRHAARWLAHAVRRAWLPLFLLAAPFSRRARRVLVGSVVASLVLEGRTNVAAGVLDDASYCAGLWRGVVRERAVGALLPRTRVRD